jgi:CMP-N-acetylneuraminic acid synthetase
MTTAFIPCRAGSERVRHKNTREFAGFPGGLLELKLRQLDGVARVGRIVISSDDDEVLRIAHELQPELETTVQTIRRPAEFAASSTSYARFVGEYVANLGIDGQILWVQVTHPFMTAAQYDKALDAYDSVVEQGFDSVATVTRIQECLWRDGAPFNYSPVPERWPRSQDIEPVWQVNHAAYVLTGDTLLATRDRMGEHPFFLDVPAEVAYDIDWTEQFEFADEVVTARRQRIAAGVL